MSKIAFDLDGVLVPDCEEIPNLGGLDEFYALTHYMRPLFSPAGEYAIITARHAKYRAVTVGWCQTWLDPFPTQIFHECLNETAGAYKEHVLNNHPYIQTYVESDIGIVNYLRNNVKTGCKIIHFSEYIEQEFYRG